LFNCPRIRFRPHFRIRNCIGIRIRNRIRNRRDTLQRVSTESESESESESGMGMEPGMGMGTIEQFGKPTHNSIPTIVRLFKSTVTKQINQIRQTPGIPVWQRNYYEHIIRDTDDLSRIRHYIENNPKNWNNDEYNINPK